MINQELTRLRRFSLYFWTSNCWRVVVCLHKNFATHVWPVHKVWLTDIWLESLRKLWEDWRADEIHLKKQKQKNSCWMLWRKSSVTHGCPDFMGKWTLFYQVLKVQSHLEGLRIHFVPESIFPWAWQPFTLLDLYHLWWLKNVDSVMILLPPKPIHQGEQVFALPVLKFLLSVIGELAFSQMLKLWMSFMILFILQ